MDNTTTDKKLPSSTTWLIAFGSVAVATLASYFLNGLGQKACAAIYFALTVSGAFAGMYFTKAKLGTGIGAFALTGAVAGIVYYFLISHLMSAVTSTMTDAVSLGQAHAQSAAVGGIFGSFFGVFAGIIVFLETIIAGVIGSIAGSRARGQGGLAAVSSLARAAR